MRQPPPVSLGAQAVRTVEAGPFLITSAHFRAGSSLPAHHHDRPILAVTLRGRWQSVIGRTSLALATGDVHVEPAGDTHSNRFGAGPPHIVVIQPDPGSAELLRPCARLLGTAARYRIALCGPLARRIETEMRAPDDLTPLALQSACLDLLLTASRGGPPRPSDQPPRWLARVVEFMRAECLSAPSIDDLSHVGGVHPGHLAREFRRAYRESPAGCLRRLRVEWAAGRLRESDDRLADIAAAASFTDQSHFTRVFTRVTGLTPASYRRVHSHRRADCPTEDVPCKTRGSGPA